MMKRIVPLISCNRDAIARREYWGGGAGDSADRSAHRDQSQSRRVHDDLLRGRILRSLVYRESIAFAIPCQHGRSR
jgi:hypothetical protein